MKAQSIQATTGAPSAPLRPLTAAQRVVADCFAAGDIRLDGQRPWDIRVKDDRFPARVLAHGTLGLGESYMDGWWDCDDLDGMCFRALRAKLTKHVALNLHMLVATGASLLFNLQSRARARVVGKRHYDLGNDFFEAMLGPTMQYSCAYYNGADDLTAAQRSKMDLISRKLGLKPGMRLLDIGCGWGSLAKHAAENYGCRVVGVTISAEQKAYAENLCRGLPAEIRLQDYRTIQEPFDRIVSVGMMEHVGFKNHRTFMQVARRCLRAGDLFLCHTIGDSISAVRPDPWIARHIFPNSMLPSAAQIAYAAEGQFIIEDVHNFGAYYDRTLLAWEKNVQQAWPWFKEHYGERFLRMWRYYLLGCAGAFRARSIQLFQCLLSADGVLGGYVGPR
jgi:cyclopropane-fatty-acyl-phospholipid synthase